MPKRTLGLSLPLLVAPLIGATGASGMEPFNPKRRAIKDNSELYISDQECTMTSSINAMS